MSALAHDIGIMRYHWQYFDESPYPVEGRRSLSGSGRRAGHFEIDGAEFFGSSFDGRAVSPALFFYL